MRVAEPYGLNGQSQRERAFTFTDLITVLAVVILLNMLQLPSAATIRGKGQSASCLNNHRQLVRAWQLYADANGERLVGNLDGGDVSVLANSNRTWVLGWFDFNGGSPLGANTNTVYLTTYSPLAAYLRRDASVFKCPADTSLSRGRTGAPRVRSVSMNGYVGERALPYTSGYRQFKKISEFVNPSPSHAFVFIDEREDGINDGVLQIDMGGFDPLQPSRYTIVDYPADWHNRGANLSFADGHTETWRWRDGRTMPAHKFGQLLPLAVASPNNADVTRIQAAASRKVTPGN
ncbi:MAG: hypothetical protein DME22_03255 [Verrucomicrobia bacterium]|nr:MAG: hypothetical protein DME22_03255 [Verrucomicrobiota bacterium]PYK01205.1 MAG: hypothetical protein DME23_04645 [Verrucomicrobiota bacterium]